MTRRFTLQLAQRPPSSFMDGVACLLCMGLAYGYFPMKVSMRLRPGSIEATQVEQWTPLCEGCARPRYGNRLRPADDLLCLKLPLAEIQMRNTALLNQTRDIEGL